MSSFAITAASAASVRKACRAGFVASALLRRSCLCMFDSPRAARRGRAAAGRCSDRLVAVPVSRLVRVTQHLRVQTLDGVSSLTAGALAAPAFSSPDRTGRSLTAPGCERAGRPVSRGPAGASLSRRDRLRRQAVGDRAAVPASPSDLDGGC